MLILVENFDIDWIDPFNGEEYGLDGEIALKCGLLRPTLQLHAWNDVLFEYFWKLELTGLVLVKYNPLSPFYRGDDVR